MLNRIGTDKGCDWVMGFVVSNVIRRMQSTNCVTTTRQTDDDDASDENIDVRKTP